MNLKPVKKLIANNTEKFVKFGIIGVSGLVVNNLVLWALVQAGLQDLYSAIIATQVAIITNFIGNNFWTWRAHENTAWKRKFLYFQGISMLAGALAISLFLVFKNMLGIPLLVANTAAIVITAAVNYGLNDRFTWSASPGRKQSARSAKAPLISILVVLVLALAVFSAVALADEHNSTQLPEEDQKNGEDEEEEDEEEQDEEEDKKQDKDKEDDPEEQDEEEQDEKDDDSDTSPPVPETQPINDSDPSTDTNDTSTTQPDNSTAPTNQTTPDDDTNNTVPDENVTLPEDNQTTPTNETNNTEPDTNSTTPTNQTTPDDDTNNTVPDENVTLPEDNQTTPTNETNNTEPDTNSTTPNNDTQPEENLSILYETQQFTASTSHPPGTPVTWRINGEVRQNSTNQSFTWTPDILYTSNQQKVQISAHAPNHKTQYWLLDVRNSINPFWESTSDTSTATLHVYTSNQYRTYTQVQARITDSRSTRVIDLTSHPTQVGETDWSTQLDAATGDTTIDSVLTTYDNVTTEHPVTQLRAHHHAPPRRSSSGGGGGGGSSSSISRDLEFIYATISDDVVDKNQTVQLTLDARSGYQITTAQATMTSEQGDYTVDLVQTGGDEYYGTWSANITTDTPGEHVLSSVYLQDRRDQETTAQPSGISFYVRQEPGEEAQPLYLGYTTLSSSTVKPGEELTIYADVQDPQGITRAYATLQDIDREKPSIDVELERVQGTAQWGGWQASVTLNESDTTYALTSVTLSNAEETRRAAVYNQRVYVEYVKPSPLTGAATTDNNNNYWTNAADTLNPFALGAAGMAFAAAIGGLVLVRRKILA